MEGSLVQNKALADTLRLIASQTPGLEGWEQHYATDLEAIQASLHDTFRLNKSLLADSAAGGAPRGRPRGGRPSGGRFGRLSQVLDQRASLETMPHAATLEIQDLSKQYEVRGVPQIQQLEDQEATAISFLAEHMIAEFGDVHIHLQNSFLTPKQLDQQGEPNLQCLATVVSGRTQKQIFRHLLSQGTRAAQFFALLIILQSFLNGLEVKTAMLKKFLIFRGNHRFCRMR